MSEPAASPLHLRALVEYDGSEYHGFQIQADKPTIQGELERVLMDLGNERIRIRYAGRTDAGVHALGQVIAWDTRWRHSLGDLERGLNALLPADIAVEAVTQVAEPRFHPRFSARRRVYQYSVWTGPRRSPLRCRYAHHVSRPVDLIRMNEAATLLVGEHDFATFGQPTQGESTIRLVEAAKWRQEGDFLRFEIKANAYLRRMVRTIVATLLEVGQGQRSIESTKQLLAARDRGLAAPPAPACGLCLVNVVY